MEHRWLPRPAPHLPVAIPPILAQPAETIDSDQDQDQDLAATNRRIITDVPADQLCPA